MIQNNINNSFLSPTIINLNSKIEIQNIRPSFLTLDLNIYTNTYLTLKVNSRIELEII